MAVFFDWLASFLFSMIRISTPLIYIALCTSISKQAGLLNLAAESMMLASALAGVIASALTQSLVAGLLCGVCCSVLVTLILCFAVYVMKVDLYLMSIAMNTALAGGTVYVLFLTTGSKSNTAATFASLQMPDWQIPLIKEIPFLGKVLSGHSGFTYIAFVMMALVWFLIYKTKIGLRIRAVGKNPQAAETMGISPRKFYTLSFVIAGVVASFGGMFLSMGYSTYFTRELTGNKGFVGLASSTIADANPFGATLVAVVFGMADTIANNMKLVISDTHIISAIPSMITVILIFILSKSRMDRQKRSFEKKKKRVERLQESGKAIAPGQEEKKG